MKNKLIDRIEEININPSTIMLSCLIKEFPKLECRDNTGKGNCYNTVDYTYFYDNYELGIEVDGDGTIIAINLILR